MPQGHENACPSRVTYDKTRADADQPRIAHERTPLGDLVAADRRPQALLVDNPRFVGKPGRQPARPVDQRPEALVAHNTVQPLVSPRRHHRNLGRSPQLGGRIAHEQIEDPVELFRPGRRSHGAAKPAYRSVDGIGYLEVDRVPQPDFQLTGPLAADAELIPQGRQLFRIPGERSPERNPPTPLVKALQGACKLPPYLYFGA